MAKKQREPLLVRYDIPTEVRKVLRGKPTKATAESLVHAMAPRYFASLKMEAEQAGEQKAVAWLERMFGLEDPRG